MAVDGGCNEVVETVFKGNCKQVSGVCACLGHCVFLRRRSRRVLPEICSAGECPAFGNKKRSAMRRPLVAFSLCPETALGGMRTVRAETTSNWPHVVAEALGARDANLSIAGATSNSHGPWPAWASRYGQTRYKRVRVKGCCCAPPEGLLRVRHGPCTNFRTKPPHTG